MKPVFTFDILDYQLKNYPQDKMFVSKKGGVWKGVETHQFIKLVNQASKALLATGVEKEDKIILCSNSCLEWNVLDMAIQQVGGIVVPVFPSSKREEIEFILGQTEAKLGFFEMEDEETNQKWRNHDSLQTLFFFHTENQEKSYPHFLSLGEKIKDETIEERKSKITTEDVAVLLYTSGTGGQPKGVMLSHQNLVSNTTAASQRLPDNPGAKAITFLPITHSYERMIHYILMYSGYSIYYAEGLKNIAKNIQEIQPDVFSAVPRFMEKIYEQFISKGSKAKGLKKQIFMKALEFGTHFDVYNSSFLYRLQWKMYQKLVFSKLKKALGGNLSLICSASATLQEKITRLFYAAEIDVFEGYGLTETSPVVSISSYDEKIVIGSCGIPLQNVEVKLGDDNEILVRGPSVMKGYYQLPELTKKVISKDGWFSTGDIGELLHEKHIKVVGRKKDSFKLSNGKFVHPAVIEKAVTSSLFFKEAVVFGAGEKHVGALIIVEMEYLKEWTILQGIDWGEEEDEIVRNKQVQRLLKQEVNAINQELHSWEQIKNHQFLTTPFSMDRNELTPTLKPKRQVIQQNYKKEIMGLF